MTGALGDHHPQDLAARADARHSLFRSASLFLERAAMGIQSSREALLARAVSR